MRDRLVHRGPDGAGFWQKYYEGQGSVNFGFRRLAIIDTREVANQPMVSNDGRKVLVFNGEIYNYVELRETLERLGRVFSTRSDTEVLLQAYEQWGHDFICRLNGMFAFIIWDEDRGEALIVRDRFGEKPLYMCKLPNGGAAFASEMKALFAHPQIACDPNFDTISDILHGNLIFAKETTTFQGVTLFKSAHKMVLGLDGAIKQYQRYWQPQYGTVLGRLPKKKLVEQFSERFFQAVSLRTRSDVPMTASLSGGLDSSSLVAILQNLNQTNVAKLEKTISARFSDDPTINEGPYIDEVLEMVGLPGEIVTPSEDELVRDLRKMHWHQETVIPGVSMYLEWRVMELAKSLGYTVILDGQGADEILAGYRIYFQAYQREIYEKKGKLSAFFMGWKRDRRLRSEARRYVNVERRFALRDSLSSEEIRGFKKHSEEMGRRFGFEGMPSYQDVGGLRHELAVNLLYTSLPSNIFSGDRNSMAHSVECRYPYLDYRLVDFCTQLPDWALIDNSWQKNILRVSMKNLLPSSVVWRVDKVGFAGPQDKWVQSPVVEKWISERLFDGGLEEVPGYDRELLEGYWKVHRESTADLSGILWKWASAAELIDMCRGGAWKE